MNERLENLLRKQVLDSLTIEERQIYEFVLQIEEDLLEQAETVEKYLSLLRKDKPIEKAAIQFQRSSEDIFHLVQEIELKMAEKLKKQNKIESKIYYGVIRHKKEEKSTRQFAYFLWL